MIFNFKYLLKGSKKYHAYNQFNIYWVESNIKLHCLRPRVRRTSVRPKKMRPWSGRHILFFFYLTFALLIMYIWYIAVFILLLLLALYSWLLFWRPVACLKNLHLNGDASVHFTFCIVFQPSVNWVGSSRMIHYWKLLQMWNLLLKCHFDERVLDNHLDANLFSVFVDIWLHVFFWNIR